MRNVPTTALRVRHALVAVSLLLTPLLAAAAAAAPSTRPAVPYDASTPLKASASLARAAAAHDAYAVTITYHATTDDERALLAAMDSAGRAAADLDAACLARFKQGLPEPAREDTGNDDEAEINGDEAFVYVGGKESGPRIRWVRVNGQWKIPMADVLRADLRVHKTLDRAVAEKRDRAKQLRQVTKEVRAGRYASPEEVETRLADLADEGPAADPRPAA